MDKEKYASGPSSWLDMHNFIGDLVASSASASGQLLKYPNQQSLRSAWETMGPEAAVPKASRQAPSAAARANQGKSMAGYGLQSGESSEESVDCDEQQIQPYTCTCPGCPLSSLTGALSLQSLKPRENSSQAQHAVTPESTLSAQAKGPGAVPLSLGLCLGLGLSLEEGSSESVSTSNSTSGRPQHQDKGTSTHSPTAGSASSPQVCPTPVQAFPCLCCHRGFQPCPQLLRPQQGSDSHFAHTHAHHHYHHHHCPLASCLSCVAAVAPGRRGSRSPPHFPCVACRRTFPTCAQLLRHQQSHAQREGLQAHACMHCTASFARPSQLLQHQRTQHAAQAGGFLCTECGRVFSSHSNLRIHLNVHTGARPYSCADCGKSFSQSGALKIHQRIHTGERPYTCAYCGRGFPHLAGVRAHQRTHTGEKPYRCVQCGKCFTQSGALKIHIRMHTGERPFVCGLCGKGFSNRAGVRFHQRTVHGLVSEPSSVGRPSLAGSGSSRAQPEQPAQPAGDPTSRDLEGEEERRVLPYACEDCGMRFRDAPSRNKHQTLEHYSAEEGGQEEGQAEQVKEHT